MKIEVIRQIGKPSAATLGQLLVDGTLFAYTIEPPVESRGIAAMAQGAYKVALSSSNEPGSLTPYAVGVPVHGAVPISYKAPRRSEARTCFIRVAETLDHLDYHTADDVELFNRLMDILRSAHAGGITIEVSAAEASDPVTEEDLEMDVHDAKRS